MSKHTPGPWIHYDDSQDGKTNRHEIVAIGKTVAHIYCSVPQEDKANARLIASAPQLLQALERLIEAGGNLRTDLSTVQGMRDMSNLLEATDAARAAIRAAKGEA